MGFSTRTFRRLKVMLAIPLALTAIGAVVVYGITAGTTSHEQTETGPPAEKIHIVKTHTIQMERGYHLHQIFVGRVEAARQSLLGFEFAGRVQHVAVDEGQEISAGQTIARLDVTRLQAQRRELTAALAEVQANLALAGQTLERTRKAVSLNAVSRQQYDEARTAEQARSAAVKRIQAQIHRVDVDIRKAILQAPFNGIVAKRHIDEGTVVNAGQVIIELLEMHRLEVRVGVSARAAQTIQQDQTIPLAIRNQSVSARVRQILPERNSQTRSVTLILELPAGTTGLRHGDLVEVPVRELITATGTWLPRNALTEAPRGLWACFVAHPHPAASPNNSTAYRIDRRPLEVLYQTGERVFVRGPLAEGEKVVISGLHRLVPDMPVLPDPPT